MKIQKEKSGETHIDKGINVNKENKPQTKKKKPIIII